MSPEYEFELPAEAIFLDGIDLPALPALGYESVKRVLDVILAVAVLALVWPLLLLAALAIKLQDFGPVLFLQDRVGRTARRSSASSCAR